MGPNVRLHSESLISVGEEPQARADQCDAVLAARLLDLVAAARAAALDDAADAVPGGDVDVVAEREVGVRRQGARRRRGQPRPPLLPAQLAGRPREARAPGALAGRQARLPPPPHTAHAPPTRRPAAPLPAGHRAPAPGP